MTLFGNSEALSNFDSTTVVDSDSTARITPIASASASSGSSTKDNDSDSSSARGIKSIPNSSEFLASLINGLGSGGGGNGSGSNTNFIRIIQQLLQHQNILIPVVLLPNYRQVNQFIQIQPLQEVLYLCLVVVLMVVEELIYLDCF